MFMGSGTTALVARRLGRNYLGTELNPDFWRLSVKRLAVSGQGEEDEIDILDTHSSRHPRRVTHGGLLNMGRRAYREIFDHAVSRILDQKHWQIVRVR